MLRCPLCHFILDQKMSDKNAICHNCDLLQGENWESVENKILKLGDQVTFPNYKHLFYRLKLTAPDQDKEWGGYNFTPRTFEILLNKYGFIVSNYGCKDLNRLGLVPFWKLKRKIKYKINRNYTDTADKMNLALGIICRSEEIFEAIKICKKLSNSISEMVIVLDDDNKKFHAYTRKLDKYKKKLDCEDISIKVVCRELNNDFAAQRNFLHDLCESPWVLHLDTDEMLSQKLLDSLSWIIQECEDKSRTVAGFPRKNFVDGNLTAAYPDFQYRLLRSHIRWCGKVHETPIPCKKNYKETMFFLKGDIEHYLSSNRLTVRRKRYESIKEGAGKTKNQYLLEIPYNGEYL